MYDEQTVLRVETVINNPEEFRGEAATVPAAIESGEPAVRSPLRRPARDHGRHPAAGGGCVRRLRAARALPARRATRINPREVLAE